MPCDITALTTTVCHTYGARVRIEQSTFTLSFSTSRSCYFTSAQWNLTKY